MRESWAPKGYKAKLVFRLFLCAVVGVGSGLTPALAASASTDSKKRNVIEGWRDYLFYRCIHEYFKGGELDRVDASISLALEYMSLDPPTTEAVVTKAKEVAERLRAPGPPGTQVAEGSEGKVAILAVCLDESRAFKLSRK